MRKAEFAEICRGRGQGTEKAQKKLLYDAKKIEFERAVPKTGRGFGRKRGVVGSAIRSLGSGTVSALIPATLS